MSSINLLTLLFFNFTSFLVMLVNSSFTMKDCHFLLHLTPQLFPIPMQILIVFIYYRFFVSFFFLPLHYSLSHCSTCVSLPFLVAHPAEEDHDPDMSHRTRSHCGLVRQ